MPQGRRICYNSVVGISAPWNNFLGRERLFDRYRMSEQGGICPTTDKLTQGSLHGQGFTHNEWVFVKRRFWQDYFPKRELLIPSVCGLIILPQFLSWQVLSNRSTRGTRTNPVQTASRASRREEMGKRATSTERVLTKSSKIITQRAEPSFY